MTGLKRTITTGAAAICIATALIATTGVSAEEKKIELRQNDAMADFLGRLAGSSVEVTLRGGTSMAGKLKAVHQHLAVLSELRSREFYDAVIRIDDISAVTVRMRDR
jgi:small nuclear ribonucleoprotein (snRNP)-like protein